MEELVYNAFGNYFNALSVKGYLPDTDAARILVYSFYKDFLCEDYRGHITEEDYAWIEQALECLYGSTCLIPYPDYLKMGKLSLGSATELAQRIKNIENVEVLKVTDGEEDLGDIVISVEENSQETEE